MTGSQQALAEAAETVERWRELTRDFGFAKSGIPLHTRISQLLVSLIETGELRPGEQLPPERELAEMLGVSLAPVRQAILDAVSKGLLVRERGRGTFVRGPGLDEKISILHSFTESMRAQHVEVETRVLRQEQAQMPPEAASALAVRQRKAMLLERVAVVGREPVALMQAYLSLRDYPELVGASFANRSLYETLKDKYGIVVARAASVIELVRSTTAEADKLGIAVGDPLVSVKGTAFDESGKPVEYFRVLYRGDRVRFHLESHRETDRVVRLVADTEGGPVGNTKSSAQAGERRA